MIHRLARALLGAARKIAFAFPFGCLTALVSHEIRFGDDHAFGGEANEAIVAVAISGSVTIALVLLHTFLTAGATTVTGTIARARARRILPGPLLTFALAAAFYYGIEMLEGNGIELGLPTLVLAAIAAVVAWTLRGLCDGLARLVHEMVRELVALLSVGHDILACVPRRPLRIHAQAELASRRFGRAPPNESRLR